MTSPNVEVVRSILAAWERGDFHSVDWADPAIEYVHGDGPEPGHWKGLSAMVTRLVLYWDREHALADLGLSE